MWPSIDIKMSRLQFGLAALIFHCSKLFLKFVVNFASYSDRNFAIVIEKIVRKFKYSSWISDIYVYLYICLLFISVWRRTAWLTQYTYIEHHCLILLLSSMYFCGEQESKRFCRGSKLESLSRVLLVLHYSISNGVRLPSDGLHAGRLYKRRILNMFIINKY